MNMSPSENIQTDSFPTFPEPPLLLKAPGSFTAPSPFWQYILDSLLTTSDSFPSDSGLVAVNEKQDQQLLLPDYRAQSLILPQERVVSHNTFLAFAILGVVFLTGLIRWLDPEKYGTFFRAFFSAKPVPIIMRDRYVFPAPGFLFVTASLWFILSFSWIPIIEDTLWQHSRGLLLWLLGGLLVYVYWLMKHFLIRLWGGVMDDKDLPGCHILFSSQGLVLGGVVGLISGIILLAGMAEAWQRTYWMAGSLAVPPVWTLVRTLAGVSFRQPVRFFYNLYYLCTLEILPLLGLWNRVPDFPSFWPAL